MGLLERVGTLIRANLNDLIDRAHPRSAHLVIQEAYAINDKGEIAVLASDDRGSVFALRAYVLNPKVD